MIKSESANKFTLLGILAMIPWLISCSNQFDTQITPLVQSQQSQSSTASIGSQTQDNGSASVGTNPEATTPAAETEVLLKPIVFTFISPAGQIRQKIKSGEKADFYFVPKGLVTSALQNSQFLFNNVVAFEIDPDDLLKINGDKIEKAISVHYTNTDETIIYTFVNCPKAGCPTVGFTKAFFFAYDELSPSNKFFHESNCNLDSASAGGSKINPYVLLPPADRLKITVKYTDGTSRISYVQFEDICAKLDRPGFSNNFNGDTQRKIASLDSSSAQSIQRNEIPKAALIILIAFFAIFMSIWLFYSYSDS